MPDTRTHRGPNPTDRELFAPEKLPSLRQASEDFCLLLSRGYAEKSSLKLVGDRFSLTERQRLAIMRVSCSDQQLTQRQAKHVSTDTASKSKILIDGYNLLITIEAALSGGLILLGRDGCYRDIASLHGTYRKVSETKPALILIGEFLAANNFSDIHWLLDSPVSNSGRLKKLILEIADQHHWPWSANLVISPDAAIIKSNEIAVSSDSVILDNCKSWLNLARIIIENKIADHWLLNLDKEV